MARYDFGLSQEEFGKLTPGMFAALLKRKAVEFNTQLYLAGLTASMIFNRSRTKDTDPILTAFDFVPETNGEDPKVAQLKQNLLSLFSMLRRGEQDILAIREKKIKELTAMGYEDVQAIFDEVFASWKVEKKQEESQKAKK